MDWNDLRFLLAVHRTGSLARAARELKVTKATASRRLAALEKSLGARLFERRSTGMTLTAPGRASLEAAEAIDAMVAGLEDRVATASDASPRGAVRLTAPPWLADRFLIPALPELKRRFPDLDVQLVGSNHLLNLAQREADLAIRNVRPSHKSLVSRRLVALGGSVYASRLYLERKGTPKSRAGLTGHDVLAYEAMGGMPGFEWLREPAAGGRVVFSANDPVALVSAASAGLGLCAVPCLLGDTEPSLVRVKSLGFETCDLVLVSHEDTRRTARVRAVAAFVAELLERHRAAIEGRG